MVNYFHLFLLLLPLIKSNEILKAYIGINKNMPTKNIVNINDSISTPVYCHVSEAALNIVISSLNIKS